MRHAHSCTATMGGAVSRCTDGTPTQTSNGDQKANSTRPSVSHDRCCSSFGSTGRESNESAPFSPKTKILLAQFYGLLPPKFQTGSDPSQASQARQAWVRFGAVGAVDTFCSPEQTQTKHGLTCFKIPQTSVAQILSDKGQILFRGRGTGSRGPLDPDPNTKLLH